MACTALEGIGAGVIALALAGCGTSQYAVLPVPRIAAASVGKPVSELEDAFGKPRKVDDSRLKETYVWYLAQAPAGAPAGFHGCELEVTVDYRSDRVLGYSLTNLGWTTCAEVSRKVHVPEVPLQ